MSSSKQLSAEKNERIDFPENHMSYTTKHPATRTLSAFRRCSKCVSFSEKVTNMRSILHGLIFPNFEKFQKSFFFQKNHNLWLQKAVLRNTINLSAFDIKFNAFSPFFFQKKSKLKKNFFHLKNQFSQFSRNRTNSFTFCGKFPLVWLLKNFKLKASESWIGK